MKRERLADIERCANFYTNSDVIKELLAHVRELEADKARIDKIIAHMENVRGDDWEAICMEWDDIGIAFIACMNTDSYKIDDLRQAIDNAEGGEQ